MSASRFKLALAQQNFRVGDVAANLRAMQECTQVARAAQADLIVFPELAVVGYPPEDLLFHRGLRARVDAALQELAEAADGIALLTGYPEYTDEGIYNTATVFSERRELARYRKQQLPNYQVFDEKRYFRAGDETVVVEVAGVRIGLLICEDIWHAAPAAAARAAGAELLLAINASPFEIGKQAQRESELRQRVKETQLPFVYLNLVGGQDELVFDGGSVVLDARGEIVLRATAFESVIEYVEFERDAAGKLSPLPASLAPIADDDATIYQALVLGVRRLATLRDVITVSTMAADTMRSTSEFAQMQCSRSQAVKAAGMAQSRASCRSRAPSLPSSLSVALTASVVMSWASVKPIPENGT